MSIATPADLATQVFVIFIRATPDEIWDAITLPDRTAGYFHGSRITITSERRASLAPDGSVRGDSAVELFDPPRRLVHGWRSLYDTAMAEEPESRVTWEIDPIGSGVCRLTLTHDRLEEAPRTAREVSGAGWMGVLSGLKTLLETGRPLYC
jgi:uncharacterized protein YndB with AHSA1/START domain